MPTDSGESPLSTLDSFINTTCPHCGGKAKRETDTMPQWAGSSWYFLRYCDPDFKAGVASKEALDYWMPVDWYNGGMEHTTLHLLYSRFWHKFLFDIGVVSTPEPYMKRTSHGMILGRDLDNPGQFTKMSKSKGNVVNPDDVIKEFGADTVRLYEMFIGDFEKAAPWQEEGIKGCKRFLDRVWGLQDILSGEEGYRSELEAEMHRTIKKVGEDIEGLKFNTAIAALMTLLNKFYAGGKVTKGEFKSFLILLYPFAPHIAEELYTGMGEDVIDKQQWCVYEEALCVEDSVEIAVQINGKVKAKLTVKAGLDREALAKAALDSDEVKKLIEGKQIVKSIGVPDKLVNIVVK